MRVRSGVLAAWTSAWLAGEAAYDDVVARVTGDDEPHRVTGLPGVDGETPLGWALPVLRGRWDVWHATSTADGAAAALLGRTGRVRTVFTDHGFPARRSRGR